MMKKLIIGIALSMISISTNVLAETENKPISLTQTQFNEYLAQAFIEEPELLKNGLLRLQQFVDNKAKSTAKDALKANFKQLFENESDPVLNANGFVPVVEFFDYRCGACKAFSPELKQLIDNDNRAKIIYKDVSILGPESAKIAKLAIGMSIIKPNAYPAYQHELMITKGINYDQALKLASLLDVDLPELEKTANSPDVQQKLNQNNNLFRDLGLRGTPSIYVGEKLHPGVVAYNTLLSSINEYEEKVK